jgi:SAM-dependent methyltransferase
MSRQRVQQLAAEFRARADATGWFEALYAEAGSNYGAVPWAELAPNPHLVDWAQRRNCLGAGRTALIIGCGYGDDAEFLAGLGFQGVAFDISPTAVAECQRRFPNSSVAYQVADLLNPPASWLHGFDLVLEVYTLQALPLDLRQVAISRISHFLAPSGQLLVIARGREASEALVGLPYPLTRGELAQFEQLGLHCEAFEDYLDTENPPVRRFRALYSAAFSPLRIAE